jgi:dephospho-CoA kinase
VIRSDGSPERDFLHVDDAVSAYLAIAAALGAGEAAGEAFNAGGERPHSVREVVELIAAAAGAGVDPDFRGAGNPDGEIDRQKLGAVVFGDPAALGRLEGIVLPAVADEIKRRVAASAAPLVLIEAIKLFEAGIGAQCDSIWVTYAPPEVQLHRLMHNRGMSEPEARQRITAQPPQE